MKIWVACLKSIVISIEVFLRMMPPNRRSAKNSTVMGVVFVDKQCGKIHAFRPFETNEAWKSGFGSTNNPVH